MDIASLRVLVVDDMTTMRKTIKKYLSELGVIDVTEAKDGELAWEQIMFAIETKRPFDIILSDWNMPNLTGLDLLKRVRGDARVGGIPFLLLTAEAEKSQVVEAITAKATGYLAKPFAPAVFEQKLTPVLEKILAAKQKSAA